MTVQGFAVRYSAWMLPFLRLVGFGPRRSTVQLRDTELRVHMGWGFDAVIPRRAIIQARRRGPIWYTAGVHTTFRGRWIVNGAASGIVALDVMPPVSVRTLGFTANLKELDLSLVEPDAFLASLKGNQP